MKNLNSIALLLVIIGGLNWLLFGLFQWDLVGGLFGGMDSVFARVVYVLVGVAALLFNIIQKNKVRILF